MKASKHPLTRQIKIALAEKDMTVADLARELKVAETTVHGWVNEPERLNLEHWAKINSKLHLDPGIFCISAGFHYTK